MICAICQQENPPYITDGGFPSGVCAECYETGQTIFSPSGDEVVPVDEYIRDSLGDDE